MKIHNVEQGSAEWHSLRIGKITASRFSDVLASGRGGGPSKTRQSYLMDLCAERLTGQSAQQFQSEYMTWGTENEPFARGRYELESDVTVEQVGFVELTDHIGCSPDGLVGNDGLLEIKCPKTTTQIQRWLDGCVPSEYVAQIQGQMWVCGREWTDFVSFDPRITNDKAFFKIRVYRDDEFIKNLDEQVSIFIQDLESLLIKLS